MAKVIIERDKCIGCGACESTCPKFFKIADDGKSSLVGGKRDPQNGNDELEADNLECSKDAAEGCPVQCIHLL